LVSIAGLLKATASLALLAPLAILGLPVATTSLALVAGRVPAQRAWTEFLARHGFSPSSALFLIYLVSSLLSLSLVLAAQRGSPVLFATGAALLAVGAVLLVRHGPWLTQAVEPTESKLRLLRTPLDRLTLVEAADRLEALIRRERGALVVTPDTTAVLRAQRDEELREIYERASLVAADGSGLVLASRLLGQALPERVSGVDLLEVFFPRAAERGYKIFLLGARPGVAEAAGRRLRRRYADLQIVGTHHGYLGHGENERVVGKIREARPDLVLVAMGVPRQEYWMAAHREALGVPVLMGVGGSLDLFAGKVRRAPRRWQKLGLEWVYRVWQEPRRLGRVWGLPVFLVQVLVLRSIRALVT
jgi:N-acetylglucosaminyldiphosphoundecaprenol N-acetyl-beta-D-mannosaminyltransferase